MTEIIQITIVALGLMAAALAIGAIGGYILYLLGELIGEEIVLAVTLSVMFFLVFVMVAHDAIRAYGPLW